ncbi:MAG: YebC/PmpR family DNA-binding transcriptional regulator [Candidatus Moranbacteria bacterium]|nr:YebC/PmpR family DNA-binding transcriptional regulator [Candidatus Moranbacteria bacterium]
MSGHSHWATTHRQKGLNDAKRGAIFTKVGRLITIAAKHGGDPGMNFKLRLAVETARSVNMPKDRIERAIKVGTGESKDGAEIEELVYEAYGPGQVALLIGVATDNRNRSLGEIRTLLTKNGGKMVAEGAVAYMFQAVGEIAAPLNGKNSDEAELTAIEAGADDVVIEDNSLAVYTKPEELQSVKESLEKAGFTIESAALSYRPTQTTELSDEDKEKYERLYELLDDHQDIQTVWDNLE